MQGTDEAERFAGFEGDDTINAGGGNDYVSGGQGDDIISGGEGDDRLFGDEGNDTFKADYGADAFDGGTGTDTVDYTASRAYYDRRTGETTGVQVNLETGQGHAGATYVSIENVIGSNYRDIITGSIDGNVINGQGGNDVIFGGGGRDTLNGGEGNDEIHGDTLSGGNGDDKLYGDEGNDTFTLDGGADLMDGGTGSDTVDYSSARTRISFVDGTIRYSGGVDVDLSTGVGGRAGTGDTYVSIENVIGTSMDDVLIGSNDRNTLTGNAENDILSGEGGDDTLIGGEGSDTLVGGADADTFVFRVDASASTGLDVIKDFELGTDQLLFTGLVDGQIVMQEVDGGTLVSVIGPGGMHSDQVLVYGVSAADLVSHGDITLI